MAKSQIKDALAWTEINPTSLGEAANALYQDYKAAYRLAKEAKGKFQDYVNAQAECPAGQEIKFGYNFGKLSVALGPKAEAKVVVPKINLADYLKGMSVAGRQH